MAVSRSEKGEQGFVLIAAIWLLILCGAVAALLLARSLAASTAAAGEAEALQARLALDAAIETVAADLLINGGRSLFAFAPSEQLLELDSQPVRVSVGTEVGKLDLNEGDLGLIERALTGFGWDAASRTTLVQGLRARRAAGERFRSMDEFHFLAARSRPERAPSCLEAYFTLHGGRAEPDTNFIAPSLARLLGRPASGPGDPKPLPIGASIRIEASTLDGASRTAIVRIGGLLDQPVMVSAWEPSLPCRA